MDYDLIERELTQKCVVLRDGSRGWRLGACFVEDALDILEQEANGAVGAQLLVDGATFELPDEEDPDYTQIVADMCDSLEQTLYDYGYTVYWEDGYCIYKDLSDDAIEYVGGGF